MQIIMPNATTMIIVSNFHKMYLTLGDDRHQVKAHTTPPPSLIPLTVGGGSSTQTSISALGDMPVAQLHAFLLNDMHHLHMHLMDKLTTQSKRIEIISTDLLAFKVDMEWDFSSFQD